MSAAQDRHRLADVVLTIELEMQRAIEGDEAMPGASAIAPMAEEALPHPPDRLIALLYEFDELIGG